MDSCGRVPVIEHVQELGHCSRCHSVISSRRKDLHWLRQKKAVSSDKPSNRNVLPKMLWDCPTA